MAVLFIFIVLLLSANFSIAAPQNPNKPTVKLDNPIIPPIIDNQPDVVDNIDGPDPVQPDNQLPDNLPQDPDLPNPVINPPQPPIKPPIKPTPNPQPPPPKLPDLPAVPTTTQNPVPPAIPTPTPDPVNNPPPKPQQPTKPTKTKPQDDSVKPNPVLNNPPAPSPTSSEPAPNYGLYAGIGAGIISLLLGISAIAYIQRRQQLKKSVKEAPFKPSNPKTYSVNSSIQSTEANMPRNVPNVFETKNLRDQEDLVRGQDVNRGYYDERRLKDIYTQPSPQAHPGYMVQNAVYDYPEYPIHTHYEDPTYGQPQYVQPYYIDHSLPEQGYYGVPVTYAYMPDQQSNLSNADAYQNPHDPAYRTHPRNPSNLHPNED